MKRNLIFLALCTAIVLGIHSLLDQERDSFQSTDILKSPSQNIISINEPEKLIPDTKAIPKKTVDSVPSPPENKLSDIAQNPKIDRDAKEPEKTYGLVINEENVAEMERNRDQLRNYAYATQTTEGWKIQLLPEDKVFLKAGINSGDLITFESMDAQIQNPERAQLANRMVAILNIIK
jgi:hypothetical protein